MGRDDKIPSIIFLTDHPIPHGMAESNRIMALAKGMVENGLKIHIVVLNPTDWRDHVLNKLSEGDLDGYHFLYASGRTVRPAGKPAYLASILIGLFKTLSFIISTYRKEDLKAIVMFHTKSIYPLKVWPIVKFLGIKLIHERNEYPFLLHKKNIWNKIDLFIYEHIAVKLFDGFLLITDALVEYFTKIKRKNARTIKINMIVDPSRFGNHSEPAREKYLAYCGSLWGDKDGVPILLEAFGLIASQYLDIRLKLIGDIEPEQEYKKLKDLIHRLGLTDRVDFTGKLSKDEIPEVLEKAYALVLARPDNVQARGGFPTKLGEFLATGRPVVITAVGEIPVFLKDGINAYIAEPGNPDCFANKLRDCLRNSEEANEIGVKGQMLTQHEFNYTVQSKKAIDFFLSLK